MQAPTWVVRFVSWRWTPSVALVSGSLAFVGMVVLIVPDEIGNVAPGTDRLSRASRARSATNVEAVADESALSNEEGAEGAEGEKSRSKARRVAAPLARKNIVQSIFHPTPPVEPPDPNPPPPTEAPPSPPPAATVIGLATAPPPPVVLPPESARIYAIDGSAPDPNAVPPAGP